MTHSLKAYPGAIAREPAAASGADRVPRRYRMPMLRRIPGAGRADAPKLDAFPRTFT